MSGDINVQTFSGKVNISNNLKVGSGHLFVDTLNNQVGLNTNDPQANLHVNGNTYVHTNFRVGSGIIMNETSGRITAGSFEGDGSALQGINSDSGSWVNGTDTVYLSTIGDKVGIGTTDPATKLHVTGDIQIPSGSSLTTSITDAFTHDGVSMPHYGLLWREHSTAIGAPLMQLSGYNGFKFFTQGTERVTISGVGNVGIGGAASTTNILKVTGTVEATTGFSGTATNATNVTLAASSTDANHSVIFSSGTTGSQALKTDPGLVYNPSTNILTTSVSGSASSITNQANSATITASSANTVNQIVLRDSNGDTFGRYIHGSYMNMSHSAAARNSDTVFYSSTDNYIRKNTVAGMRSSLGLANSATITATQTDTASTIVMRDGSGDMFARLFRSDYQNQTDCGAGIAFRNSTTDNYIRFCTTMSAVRSRIGCAETAGSTGQDFNSKECYVQNWVRTRGNAGHYWESSSNGNGWHIYPKDRSDMRFRSGSGNGSICGTVENETARGYIHWTTGNEIGFLNHTRNWSLRMDGSNNCQVYGRMYASGYVYTTMLARYYNSSGNNGAMNMSRPISVYAEHQVRCQELQVTSDRRIKTDIRDVDDSSALELLRKIQPKTYGYVDTMEKGTGHVYGFIAQEIKELIPEAVDVSEGDLPNIYRHATIDHEQNAITFKDFDTGNLNQKDSIIYIDADDQRQTLKIKSIINSTQLEIEEDLEKLSETFKTSKMEEYKFTGEIFIWGQHVNDFHHLQKSAIYTVATAALQEVDRQLQAEKTKTYELQQKVEILEMSHGALIQRIEALEKL